MNTTIIFPRMIEAGVEAARAISWVRSDTTDDEVAELAAAIYTAMTAKHLESLEAKG